MSVDRQSGDCFKFGSFRLAVKRKLAQPQASGYAIRYSSEIFAFWHEVALCFTAVLQLIGARPTTNRLDKKNLRNNTPTVALITRELRCGITRILWYYLHTLHINNNQYLT